MYVAASDMSSVDVSSVPVPDLIGTHLTYSSEKIMPRNMKVITIECQADINPIYVHTALFKRSASFLTEGPLVTLLIGGSVERAIAAKVSMIKLTHNNYTAENGDSLKMIPPIITVIKQEMFTVIWNCKNLVTL